MTVLNIRRLAVAGAAVSLLALGACASAAKPEAITVLPSTISAAQPVDVGYHALHVVNVSGGSDTNPMWTSQVSTGDFKTALEASLAAAGYLGENSSPMSVTATIIDLKQPMMGLDMSVTSQVRYSVLDASGRSIFDETVAATGTAKMSEQFMGVERLRMANEYSVRENIKGFIERFRAHVAR